MNLYVVLLNYNLTILIRIVVKIHYYYHCCVGFFLNGWPVFAINYVFVAMK